VPPPPPPPPPPAPTYGVPPPPPPGYGGQPYGQQPSPYGALGGYGGERAGFGVRLGGYLLDQLLYGLVFVPFAVVGFIIGAQSVRDCSTIDDEIRCDNGEFEVLPLLGGIAIGLIGVALVAVLYFRALGRTGQTWGRKIVGIKVVRSRTGEPLGVGRAIGRQLFAGFISGQVCYLGYLWMLWDEQKQTWHDKVVDSIVVRA
jgi:uncharacterized RDD family membrane protein YckC